MAQIVCQATADLQSDELELIWSEGPASFEPYHLRGTPLKLFDRAIGSARKALFKVVLLSRDGKAEQLPDACFKLAEAGNELYEAFFPPKVGQNQDPDEIRAWLEGLRDQSQVESLEVLLAEKNVARAGSTPRAVPWNVLYDEKPNPDLFRTPAKHRRAWEPFWGVRYNLAMGRKVDPRRRTAFPDRKLHVVFVVDPDPRVLPPGEWSVLEAFARQHAYPILRSHHELENYKADHPVDLLYLLCHADPSALVLGGSKIDAVDLYRVCQRLFQRPARGLAVLNACQTGREEGREGSFMEALHDAGLSGMIATEERTVNVFANRFGLDLLQAFLVGGEAIGPALQKLRGDGHPLLPLGLLYGTYCPPHIRAWRTTPEAAPSPATLTKPANAQPQDSIIGAFLGPQAEPAPLPEHPYRSLDYYDRKHRALFAGRDDDVLRFALLLDEADSRIVVLHGQSGVGKSSFLRAGLIPFLEDECIGYKFLRDRHEGRDEPILFIRATRDPAGPLAKALCDFCARGEKYPTPGERRAPVEVDLPGILGRFLQGTRSPAALRDALRADTSLLGRLLAALAERLPYTLVLVIDQGEEVFTLARTREDEDSRTLALEMLRRLLEASGRFEVIVSLRTEYYGRLLDALRQDVHGAKGIRDYLLTELQEGKLAEAILRPTATVEIPHASEVPAKKYRFHYEPGLAEAIAREVRDFCRSKQDSELPLAQIICTQLYERARQRPDAVISRQDFEQIGGVKGGLRKHVETLLADLLPHPGDRKAFKRLFCQLYRRQPDRLVTTELVLEEELKRQWGSRNRLSFDKMIEIASRSDRNLLRVKTLPGQQGERRYVSLGHDALARVAADWDEESTRGARFRKQVFVIGGFLLVGFLLFTAVVAVIAIVRISSALDKMTQALEETEVARRDAEASHKKTVEAERRVSVTLYSKRIGEADRALSNNNVILADELLDLCKTETPEFCLWEWRYLKRLCRAAFINPKGGHSINDATVSADGQFLAAADQGCSVLVWEVANLAKKPIVLSPLKDEPRFKDDARTPERVLFDVHRVALSSDGQRLAAGAVWQNTFNDPDSLADDATVLVWEVANFAKKPVQLPAGKSVLSIAFSPDGQRLAAAGMGGIVRVWEVANLAKKPVQLPAGKSVKSIAFSPDGQRLAAAGMGGIVRVWELANLAKLPLEIPASEDLRSVAFSPDGQRLAVAGMGGIVRVWELANLAKLPLEIRVSKDLACSVAFSSDGQHLVTAGGDGVVTTWETGKPRKRPQAFTASKGPANRLALFAKSQRLAVVGKDGNLRVWTIYNLTKRSLALPAGQDTSYSVAFSPDGQRFAATGKDGIVRAWEVAHLAKKPLELPASKDAVYSVVFSTNSQRLAATGMDGIVRVWELPNLAKKPIELSATKDPLYRAVFSPDGQHLAAAGKDGNVRVWDTANFAREPLVLHKGKLPENTVEAEHIGGHKREHAGGRPIFDVAFSPDGERLAASGPYGIVRVWEVAKFAKEPLALTPHMGSVGSVAFSLDGQHLAAAARSGDSVQVWELANLTKTPRQLSAPKDEDLFWKEYHMVNCVVFSPDGQRLVTTDADGIIRIWDASLGQELLALKGPASLSPIVGTVTFRSIAFSSDGHYLAIGNHHQVELLDATPITSEQ